MLSKDNDWNIDTSAGVPILVYKNCSVIESEQAEYILQLINNEVEMAAELLSLREQLAALKALEPFCHVFLHPDGPLFTAAKPIKTPVTPPLTDVDNLSGHELDCAKFHNNAIAMCSIAIRQAGYPSECSATFYPTDKQGG
ncbi:Uncharacterised protein [Yersinia pseudotuberculosis]|uniref:hypothetical protein n=1 Tax=Yersinia pseudotuberculosis TaxID=633 RepID=UPI0005DB4DBD|nr:hypothetical protein [Yersinia pseudotuberculosis]CNK54065.1 Uncharacterised protein [Yersinia pseudotuberculosis]